MGNTSNSSLPDHQVFRSRPTSEENPGILLLSTSRSIIFVTPYAQRILILLRDSKTHPHNLPSIVTSLCDDLQQMLAQCSSYREWSHVQVQRIAHTLMHSIMLHGFVIPEADHRHARLLVMMEPQPTHKDDTRGLAIDCRLTARQQSIARGLIRGLTNKELASELQISTHTVKEYVRIIMTKLRTSTRSGAVAILSSFIDSGMPLSHDVSPPGRTPASRQWT